MMSEQPHGDKENRDIDPLRLELDAKRSEIQRCYSMLESLMKKQEVASSDVDTLKQDLAICLEDNRYLKEEIGKLRHGYDGMAELKAFYQTELSRLRKFSNSLIERVQALDTEDFEITAPLPEKTPPASTAYHSDYEANSKLIRKFYGGLDVPESHLNWDAAELIHIGGWCFDSEGRVPKRIWVLVGEQEVPCSLGWKREDVVEAFDGQIRADLRCGFNVEISAGPGINSISVYAEFMNGAELCIFRRTILRLGSGEIRMGQLDQDYESWVELFDTLDDADIAAIEAHIKTFQDKPLISVLLPVYNTDARWLTEAIESVRAQIYPHWELCIADDASPLPHVKSILDHYKKLDSRIKVVIRKSNGHISAATNSALELADGLFCALLDHDDVLPQHALYHVALELNRHPQANLIFSDEDKIDEKGQRFDPYFKSDWNPELFRSHNCLSHLGVYRTSILREIGGFREELYGSQDWDLAFRFIEATGEEGIIHIPRALYHWRYLDSSTAKSIESKPYAVTAGMRAIENHLCNKRISASVMNGMWAGAFRVKYHLDRPVFASILIPCRGDVDWTKKCVESVLGKTIYPHFEILLVCRDAEGEQKEPDFINRPNVRQICVTEDLSLSRAYNQAVSEAKGEVLIFLSNDTEAKEAGWLEEMISQVMQPEIGAVGAWLQYPDRVTQHGGLILCDNDTGIFEAFHGLPESDIGHMGRAHLTQRYSAVSGVCMATLKSDFEKLGGFDTDRLGRVLYDVDYCLRLKHELKLHSLWTPYAKLCYREIFPRGYDVEDAVAESENAALKEKWGNLLKEDSYFNPNLSLKDPRFFLAWPPRVDKPWNEH